MKVLITPVIIYGIMVIGESYFSYIEVCEIDEYLYKIQMYVIIVSDIDTTRYFYPVYFPLVSLFFHMACSINFETEH